jgi:hypothetical protein
MNQIKKISVVPLWNQFRGNRIFESEDVVQTAFGQWREVATTEGFELNTDDILHPRDADAVWFVDLPRKRKLFNQAIGPRRDSSKKLILQVLESPLISPSTHQTGNHTSFDYVLSYSETRCLKPSHFHYRLPNNLNPEINRNAFSARKCVVMINKNQMEGWFGTSRTGERAFPGFGKYLNGWKTSLASLVKPDRGELYSWRRKFARTAESRGYNCLDIYGFGWTGEPITWLPKLRPRPFRCADQNLQAPPGPIEYSHKIPLISKYRFGVAVENYEGSLGYISEKLFDVMRAGTVPIYLGDRSISKIIPPQSFVDVRHFKNHDDLLNYLINCPEAEWQEMLDTGQEFLTSNRAQVFGVKQFVDKAMEILRQV